MDPTFTEAGTAFAIVSPCSQCQNQLSDIGPNGEPYCPRRKWMSDQALYKANNNGNNDPRLIPLALYGTEGTPQAGDKTLKNPVYWSASNSALIWIAAVRDNSGLHDDNDNVIAPSILDPSFIPNYTKHIQCRALPYIPAVHEAAYRTSGGLKEGDEVLAINTLNQQNYAQTVVDTDNDNPALYQQVLIEGVIQKVNLVFNTPRATVDMDYVIQGT